MHIGLRILALREKLELDWIKNADDYCGYFGSGIPVGLSIFSTNNVIVDCVLVGASGVIESKKIMFLPAR
jgi:hypothetical protein